MEIIIEKYLFVGVVVLVYMTLWFLYALTRKRNDVADVAWGLGFFLIALVVLVQSFFSQYDSGNVNFIRPIFVTLLVGIWAIRLSVHIYFRNRGKGEDYRYKEWREQWGKWFYIRTYFQVFILQGALMLLVVSPVVIINTFIGGAITWFDFLGTIVWITGFLFETIGDWQLLKFIKNPSNKGKIMQSGLWKYTRHPNYFGEVTLWWGLWIVALSVPYGWLGIIGPATITILILKVSGIPLLEKKMEGNPDFENYKKRTSIFFPLPVKK